MIMLTPRQNQLLRYIHQRQQNEAITPSFEEMRVALGLKSKSGVHQLITALIQRGYIQQMAKRSRALRIVHLPQALQKNTIPAKKQEIPPRPQIIQDDATTTLPFLGRIAAGMAIEAIEYADEKVIIPSQMLGRGTYFVLEICGDSMVDIGILDGDQVIIRQQHTADNGDIVVACIDNEEVTLKRFQRRGHSIALQPENTEYQTQIYSANRVTIKGILAGLLRQY